MFRFILVAILFHAAPAFAAPDFNTWVEDFKEEAISERGISKSTLDKAFAKVKLIERVVQLDRKQPEFSQTLHTYLTNVVSKSRVQKAKVKMKDHADLLRAVHRQYRVDPRIIVTLWGIETNFGRTTGSFSVVNALVTLAYDGRRSAYFRKELLNALQILDEGHISLDNMKGSWAGAMGQNQFMPSSFLNFAVDHNGDSKKNIWTDTEDALASIGNYLHKSGWRQNGPVAWEVKIPDHMDLTLAENKKHLTTKAWDSLGVRNADGGPLPMVAEMSRLLLPEGEDGPAYLAFKNFDVILKWNRANFFAIAAGKLSDQLRTEQRNILVQPANFNDK